MKKISLVLCLMALVALSTKAAVTTLSFPTALKTCENYSKTGGVTKQAQYFGITITLNKSKNKCIYKEKISQGKDWELLTCVFEKEQLPAIADSMQRFNDAFKADIAKNTIFEAKMTTNGEIFNGYLTNPNVCKVTHSKNTKQPKSSL